MTRPTKTASATAAVTASFNAVVQKDGHLDMVVTLKLGSHKRSFLDKSLSHLRDRKIPNEKRLGGFFTLSKKTMSQTLEMTLVCAKLKSSWLP